MKLRYVRTADRSIPSLVGLWVFLLVVAATAPAGGSPIVLTPDHVVIVVEENHSYSQIIGDTTDAPYMNALAAGGANFTDSHAEIHPSQPNYVALFSGSTYGMTTDSMYPHSLFTGPNLGSKLLAAGLTFTGYSETLPSVGYDGTSYPPSSTTGYYKRKHNPWVNWQDSTTPLPANKLPLSVNQPYTSFPTDFSALPTLSFVIPNTLHDMHDGTIAQADQWLQADIASYATWAMTHNSLLILTWDENNGTTANHIPTIFYGQGVVPGNYTGTINHYNVLATLEDMYGLPHTDNSVGASPVTDIWTTVPATLHWTGAADNTWDVSPTTNWLADGSPRRYREGDNAVFDDTGAYGQPVLVSGTVNPSSVLVNNATASIVFGGTGSIAGSCGLTKSGAGSLALALSNAYTGDTRINEGTLIVASPNALGASAVKLGDTVGAASASLLISGALVVDRPITVQDDGSPTSLRTLGGTNTAGVAEFSGAITLRKDLTLTAALGGEVELVGALDDSGGHTITKIGQGTVIFGGLQTYGPGALLDVEAGTVDLNADAGIAGSYLSITVTDAVVNFGSDQHLDTLDIGPGGKVVFAGAHLVVLNDLVMSGFDFGAMTLTPEPATLALLAVGGVLAFWRRTRRRAPVAWLGLARGPSAGGGRRL
jgi:autotransporter-associated beta strand protein